MLLSELADKQPCAPSCGEDGKAELARADQEPGRQRAERDRDLQLTDATSRNHALRPTAPGEGILLVSSEPRRFSGSG